MNQNPGWREAGLRGRLILLLPALAGIVRGLPGVPSTRGSSRVSRALTPSGIPRALNLARVSGGSGLSGISRRDDLPGIVPAGSVARITRAYDLPGIAPAGSVARIARAYDVPGVAGMRRPSDGMLGSSGMAAARKHPFPAAVMVAAAGDVTVTAEEVPMAPVIIVTAGVVMAVPRPDHDVGAVDVAIIMVTMTVNDTPGHRNSGQQADSETPPASHNDSSQHNSYWPRGRGPTTASPARQEKSIRRSDKVGGLVRTK